MKKPDKLERTFNRLTMVRSKNYSGKLKMFSVIVSDDIVDKTGEKVKGFITFDELSDKTYENLINNGVKLWQN